MCGKKERNLIPQQKTRIIQSRPIILNRRSLSSSSIPRKKRDVEIPCTSRDESHILHIHNDITEPFNSQTVPLPSHKLLIEDVWKFGDGCVPAAYSNSANSNIQQPCNLISGHQQLPLLQHSNTLMTSNPYIFVGHGASVEQRNTKPLVMYNPSVNSASNQNLATSENPSRRILLPNTGKENTTREIPILPSQLIEPLFLENPVNATKLFDVKRVAVNESSSNDLVDDSLSAISWMGQIHATNILPSIDPPRNLEAGRPPYSYMALIQFAINSSPTQRMTLKQIYNWIEETFPYFKRAKPGWKNSIRHNLSLHDIFIREILPSSKSSFWTLRPDLNQRPLTLACVAARMGNIQPVPLSTIGVSSDGSTGLQQISNIAQPYVLMPVNQNSSTPILKPKCSPTDPQSSSFATSRMQQMDGDSGFNLDMSDLSLTHVKENKKEPSIRKRKRKQPLEILNDSLNDSLHFTESLISPLVNPLLQDEDSETGALPFCNSTPASSTWMKQEPRRTSLESESGYFEQTCSSVTSTDLLMTPQSHYDITNSFAGRTTSSNESELGCFEQKHSSNNSTDVSITPKRHCADANVGVFTHNQDTGSDSVNNFGVGESAMTDGLPQLLGMEGFSFNSSFAKLLNSSNVSLFNLSDRSVQFSDFEDL